MKKILLYILIFTTITGGLFGVFGIGNEAGNNLLGVEQAYAAEKPLYKEYGISCDGLLNFNVGQCISVASYYLYVPTSYILKGSGILFNKMLAFSMSSDVVNQPFVTKAWDATRGFANMLFILVLVVISISIILDIGKFTSKQLIVKVIIIALLVNFSLFAAKVVIDAGNIVALGFYDSIITSSEESTIGIEGDKDISGAIVKSFNPAQLLSPTAFKLWRDDSSNESSPTASNAMLSVIFIMGAAINLYTAYLFFMAGVIFVVRIAYLWILMALAPLAFVSFAIPGFGNHWTKWWDQLFKKSFVIVVFMFMIWLTLMIIGNDFLGGVFGLNENESAKNIIEFLVIVVMQYMIVIILLKESLIQTKKMSDAGVVFDKISGAIKGAGAMALGAATGGTSLAAGLAARRTLGGMASGMAGKIQERQSQGKSTGLVGRMALRGAKDLEKYKFGTKEGYKQQVDRVADETKAMAKGFKDQEASKTWFGMGKMKPSKSKADIEREYYEKQQSLSGRFKGRAAGAVTAAMATGVAPYLAVFAPVALALDSRSGGEKKAFKDYKKRKDLSIKEKEKLELIRTKQQELEGIKKSLKQINDGNYNGPLVVGPNGAPITNPEKEQNRKKFDLEDEIKKERDSLNKIKEEIKGLK